MCEHSRDRRLVRLDRPLAAVRGGKLVVRYETVARGERRGDLATTRRRHDGVLARRVGAWVAHEAVQRMS